MSTNSFVRSVLETILREERSAYLKREWGSEEVQDDLREGRSSGCIPKDCELSDFHPDTIARITAFCEWWQSLEIPGVVSIPALLERYEEDYGYDREDEGRHFWYQISGAGTGFWDRDADEVGDQLAKFAGCYDAALGIWWDGEAVHVDGLPEDFLKIEAFHVSRHNQ